MFKGAAGSIGLALTASQDLSIYWYRLANSGMQQSAKWVKQKLVLKVKKKTAKHEARSESIRNVRFHKDPAIEIRLQSEDGDRPQK